MTSSWRKIIFLVAALLKNGKESWQMCCPSCTAWMFKCNQHLTVFYIRWNMFCILKPMRCFPYFWHPFFLQLRNMFQVFFQCFVSALCLFQCFFSAPCLHSTSCHSSDISQAWSWQRAGQSLSAEAVENSSNVLKYQHNSVFWEQFPILLLQ